MWIIPYFLKARDIAVSKLGGEYVLFLLKGVRAEYAHIDTTLVMIFGKLLDHYWHAVYLKYSLYNSKVILKKA